jgi:hypothetical protein
MKAKEDRRELCLLIRNLKLGLNTKAEIVLGNESPG